MNFLSENMHLTSTELLCSLHSVIPSWNEDRIFTPRYFEALECWKVSFVVYSPEGIPGMLDTCLLSGISGLSFDSILLSPLLSFCLVLLPFLSYLFFCLLALSSKLFPENSSIFFVKR